MTNGINLLKRRQHCILTFGQDIKDSCNSTLVVHISKLHNMLFSVWSLEFKKSVGEINLFDTTLGKDSLAYSVYQFILYR